MKSRSILKLIRLYLAYHCNKMTFLILGIVLFLWVIVAFLNTGIPLEMDKYIADPNLYHSFFLEQSIFFLQLIDGVVVAFLVGTEISSLSLFDPMLVPNVSRIKIICSKLLANLIILLMILTFQVSLLELVGVIVFPKYASPLHFQLILYLSLPLLELLLLGEFVSILMESYFIPILLFVIHILSSILLKTEKISEILSILIPKTEILHTQIILNGNIVIFSGVCALLILCIALVFQKKDISNV